MPILVKKREKHTFHERQTEKQRMAQKQLFRLIGSDIQGRSGTSVRT